MLSPATAADLASTEGQSALMHEFGHCLGLTHSWAPTVLGVEVERPDLWGSAPVMSYGLYRGAHLLPDDLAGARLLRPDPGSIRGRGGSIAGLVTVGGNPAAFVGVVASPTLGAPQQAVHAFADRRGRFEIEGLRPGAYRRRAGPIQYLKAHEELARSDATVDAGDVFHLGPLEVRAGEVAGLVRIELPTRTER